jgi:hypothetical protein
MPRIASLTSQVLTGIATSVSLEPGYYNSLTLNGTSYDEGDTVIATLTATNVPDGTTVEYTVTGVSANDLSSGTLTGAFTLSSGSASATWILSNDELTEGTDNFIITLAAVDSLDNTTNSLTDSAVVVDTSNDPLNVSLIFTLDNPNLNQPALNDEFGYSISMSGNRAIVGAPGEQATVQGDETGAAYIFDLTTGALVHTLENPTPILNDRFGEAVAIDGDRAIVGAEQADDVYGTDSGKAYIYNATTGGLIHTLDNPNAYGSSVDDQFGLSVAISGDYAIVGAFEDDAGGLNSGKAYILNATTGALVHTLDNPNAYTTSANDYFGYAVAISSNYAIVGAYQEDDAGGTSSGKAYIFNVTTGALVHTLDNPNLGASASDLFGYAVAISGAVAIVGAYQDDFLGKAYIFDASTGALLHTLDNPNVGDVVQSGDRFGWSVAISGNYVIVGAPYEDMFAATDTGKAYIFDVTTGALVHTLDNPNPDDAGINDNFGQSVAISGNSAIVGAGGEDTGSGKAYIYNVTTGALVHTLDNPNPDGVGSNDSFGSSVAIDGNSAIVGAYGEDDASGLNSGKAYIFDVTTGTVDYTLDNPNPDGVGSSDFFGRSVAISGNRAIVGANGEEDIDGLNSGKAYIFDVTTGTVDYTLDNPNAYTTSTQDYFGASVAISGNRAIVGAYGEDDANTNISGKAYIFDVTTGALVHTLDNPNPFGVGTGDYFGWKVGISGNYAIVSARWEDDAEKFPAGDNSGKAYIFDVTTGALVHQLDNPNAYGTTESDFFGTSVAISGNYAIVGAPGEDDGGTGLGTQGGTGLSSGKAYIFNVTSGALVHTLDNPNAYNTSAGDQFGFAVAIDGNSAIVAAYGEDDDGGLTSGKAYIFNVTDGLLLHTVDNPNAFGTSAGDQFGYAVAISGDRCIVGANLEDDDSTSSGTAYVYTLPTA